MVGRKNVDTRKRGGKVWGGPKKNTNRGKTPPTMSIFIILSFGLYRSSSEGEKGQGKRKTGGKKGRTLLPEDIFRTEKALRQKERPMHKLKKKTFNKEPSQKKKTGVQRRQEFLGKIWPETQPKNRGKKKG